MKTEFDWASTATINVLRAASSATSIQITQSPQQWQELAQSLAELAGATHQELKVLLPKQKGEPLPVEESWVIYFKKTQGSNRSLLAHPNPDEWVGTILLTEEKIRALSTQLVASVQLATVAGAGECSLAQVFKQSYPSNLGVEFRALR